MKNDEVFNYVINNDLEKIRKYLEDGGNINRKGYYRKAL